MVLVWFEQSLTPHPTQYRSFRRRTAHQKTPISAISILTAIFRANLRHYSSTFTFFLQLSLKKTFGDKMYKYFEGCMHVIRPTGQKRRRKLRALTTKRKSHPLAPTFPIYPKAPDSRGLAYCYPTPMPILKKSTTITTIINKSIWPVKNSVMRCWCGDMSGGVRCRLFAYGLADATAIPKPHLNPH